MARALLSPILQWASRSTSSIVEVAIDTSIWTVHGWPKVLECTSLAYSIFPHAMTARNAPKIAPYGYSIYEKVKDGVTYVGPTFHSQSISDAMHFENTYSWKVMILGYIES